MIFDPPYTLVILDDDDDIHPLIKADLKEDIVSEKLNIKSCKDYNEAKTLLEEGFIHFILLDMHLKNQNGLELIRDLKALESGLKIITFSSDSSITACYDCFRHGADYHLRKPVKKEALRNIIHRCIETMEIWQETFLED